MSLAEQNDQALMPYQLPFPKEAQDEIVVPNAVPEDERIWVVVAVLLNVCGEHLGDTTRDDHGPMSSRRLRWAKRRSLALHERQCLIDSQRSVLEVDVASREAGEFAVAQA